MPSLTALIEAMPFGPWAAPAAFAPPSADAPDQQASFMFRPETRSALDAALAEDIHEGGDGDSTRFARFSQVAGHYLAAARRDGETVADAKTRTLGWMLAHMIPPWPEPKASQEFDAIAGCEIRAKGAFPAPEAPLVLPEQADQGLHAHAVCLWGDKAPEVDYIVDKLIVRGEPHMYVGEGSAGKTGGLLDLAMKIASHGKPGIPQQYWNGQKIMQQGMVVLLLAEDSKDEIHRRCLAIDGGRGLIKAAGLDFIALPLPSLGGAFPLAEEDHGSSRSSKKWGELLTLMKERHPNMILTCIDTFNAVHHGEESSAQATGQMMREANRVPGELKAAILFNHHPRKAGQEPVCSLEDLREAIRGSSAIPASFRITFGLYQPMDYARRLDAMGEKKIRGRLWRFGMVKCNIGGLMSEERTLLRNMQTGLLEDVTARDKFSVVNLPERLAWLLLAIREAAKAGHPYTNAGRGGANGLYRRRAELPEILRHVGAGEFAGLIEQATQDESAVLCSVRGSSTKAYLDLPGGPLATNDEGEELVKGAFTPPNWSEWTYDPVEKRVLSAAQAAGRPFQNCPQTELGPKAEAPPIIPASSFVPKERPYYWQGD